MRSTDQWLSVCICPKGPGGGKLHPANIRPEMRRMSCVYFIGMDQVKCSESQFHFLRFRESIFFQGNS